MLNRRGFLGVLGAAVAGAAFDPELALWVPGRKSFAFIKVPPVIRVGDFVALTNVGHVVGGRNYPDGRYFLYVTPDAIEPLTGDGSRLLGVATQDVWPNSRHSVQVQIAGRVTERLGRITSIA